MTEAYAIDWFRDVLWNVLLVAGPVIAAIVVVGLVVAVLQATTSVNDQAVAFGPKGLVGVLALAASGPWMLKLLTEFATRAFTALAHLSP